MLIECSRLVTNGLISNAMNQLITPKTPYAKITYFYNNLIEIM